MRARLPFQRTPANAARRAAVPRAGAVPSLDNRAGAVQARALVEGLENSPRVRQQQKAFADIGDNRFVAAQRGRLQEMFGGRLRPQREQAEFAPQEGQAGPIKPAVDEGAVQMKIHVKSGKKYDGVKSGITGRIKTLTEAAGVFLVQSDQHIEDMKQGLDVPVLAPKKHLIGEHHNVSEFTKAVEKWGWAASMLIESYSKHGKLKDPAEEAKKQTQAQLGTYDENFMYARAGALEDTAAKGLTNLVNAQIFGAEALALARDPGNAIQDQPNFKTTLETIWHKYDGAQRVAMSLATYLRESVEAYGLGIFGSYFPEHALVKSTVTETLFTEIGAGLDNVYSQLQNLSNLVLDPNVLSKCNAHIDRLVPVLQKLIVAHDPSGLTFEQIATMSLEAKTQKKIGKLNPLRERYMVESIKAAKVPSLVKIGRHHVDNLRANLPAETIAYDDYTSFKDKNTAQNVDV